MKHEELESYTFVHTVQVFKKLWFAVCFARMIISLNTFAACLILLKRVFAGGMTNLC
jgi:hypothetical protein